MRVLCIRSNEEPPQKHPVYLFIEREEPVGLALVTLPVAGDVQAILIAIELPVRSGNSGNISDIDFDNHPSDTSVTVLNAFKNLPPYPRDR